MVVDKRGWMRAVTIAKREASCTVPAGRVSRQLHAYQFLVLTLFCRLMTTSNLKPDDGTDGSTRVVLLSVLLFGDETPLNTTAVTGQSAHLPMYRSATILIFG